MAAWLSICPCPCPCVPLPLPLPLLPAKLLSFCDGRRSEELRGRRVLQD